MSSILKALEKVEQSQNTRRSSGPSGLSKSRQRRPAWVLPVGVIGGAAAASLLTFAAMGGFSKHAATTAQPNPAPAVQREAVAVQPAPVAATPQPQQIPVVAQKAAAAVNNTAVATVKPAPAAQNAKQNVKVVTPAKPAPAAEVVAKQAQPVQPPVAKKVAAAHTAPAKPAKVATANPSPAHSAKAARLTPAIPVAVAASARPAAVQAASVQPAAVRQAAPVAPPVQVAQAKSRPDVRVTGIAWQNDSQSSAAIVNGHMVSHGGTVDGFKVEQIFEDRVRFSGKNGTVDVPLSAGE